jgi:biotin synthase-like enzyme
MRDLKSGEAWAASQSCVPLLCCACAAGILEETTNKGNRQLEKALFSHADAVSNRFFGDAVYYRGICEFSNVCTNDCGYCGIRKHQKGVRRYTMPVQEVVDVSVQTQHASSMSLVQL